MKRSVLAALFAATALSSPAIASEAQDERDLEKAIRVLRFSQPDVAGNCHLDPTPFASADDPIWTNHALCNWKTKKVHFCFVQADDSPPDPICVEDAQRNR
jgi:hypothetical protein